ncbi:MAG: DNA alkylation repair protein [Planctomycetota bacterium]
MPAAKNTPQALVRRADLLLGDAAVPTDAAPMEAYMKGVQPFFGVKKPRRVPIVGELTKDFAPQDAKGFRERLELLFRAPYRERRYVALELGRKWKKHLDLDALPLVIELVRDRSWWDTVDELAQHFVGPLWLAHPKEVGREADRWIRDDDFWVRRVAIIGQNRHRARTDAERLFRYCERQAHEKEFFLRKAIGWALREYAKTDAAAVRAFVERMGDALSGLSRREALRGVERAEERA